MLTQFQAELFTLTFWVSLCKIAWIDILLSGDNALVIAMVCRGLPARQRLLGMILGAAAAVAMRVTLTGSVAALMTYPFLKIIGGGALGVVAVKILIPAEDSDDVGQAGGLLAAIAAVLVADLTMSIDNIIAVGAAARGDVVLVAIGLALSIPLVVAGASVIAAVLDRLPLLVWLGAALLGWIAGDTIVGDPIIASRLHLIAPQAFGPLGATCVLLAGFVGRELTTSLGDTP